MPEIYYSLTTEWESFLKELQQEARVYLPQPKEEDYVYQEFKGTGSFSFNPYRPIQPVKTFFFYPQEKVAGEFSVSQTGENAFSNSVVIGLKNCDLHSLRVQDYVFKEGVESDSAYTIRRDNTVLVSSDCTAFKKVCFCLALEVNPYPTEGYDLNISQLTDGLLIDVGSNRGKELIKKYQKYFSSAKDSQISVRDSKRENLVRELNNQLKDQGLPERGMLQQIVKKGYTANTWQNFCRTCVECGACNFICCTCHCFLLSDVKEKDTYFRARIWDSCQYANFARVAGGANPMKRRAERLRNRFLKKFDFFVDNLNIPACEGCGRCIEACPGKIDIREVLKDLAKNA